MVMWLEEDDTTTPEGVNALHSLRRDTAFMTLSICGNEDATEFLTSIPLGQRQDLALLLEQRRFHRLWTLARTRCLCESHELDVEAASMLAALSLRIVQGKRPTSGSLKESDGLSIDVLGGAACISA